MTDHLTTLVRAIATKILRECETCDGQGKVPRFHVSMSDYNPSPCPVCGDVRRALAAMEEEEEKGEVGG